MLWVLAACVLSLIGGYLLKAQCLAGFDGRQYERLCYNDLQPLYGLRGIEQHTFPYVSGSLEGSELANGAIEYPVLTGVFMWASGLLASDGAEFLRVSAILLAPFAVLTAYLLARLTGARAFMWAAAPALVLYAFHNWDLLVVAAATAGLWSWYRSRTLWAALWFGIGGALKAYPLFFLAPLVLERWQAGERKQAALVAGAGVGTFAAINLPFALINFDGWWATYAFHRQRVPNFETIWHLGFDSLSQNPAQLNLVTTVLIAASFVVALGFGWRRGLRTRGSYPFLQVAGAMLAAFLLFNKIHSPQYALWLLPFFALLRINLLWWVGYSIADLLVYVGIFRWFYDRFYLGQEMTFAQDLYTTGVWMRAALLVLLFVVFLRSQNATADREAVVEVSGREPVLGPAPVAR